MNVRPISADDYQAVVDLLVEDEEALLGAPSRMSVNDLREYVSRTDLANDSRLYEEDGRPVAVGWVDTVPAGDLVFAAGAVRQGWKERGLGSRLVDHAEACAARHGARRIHQFGLGADAAAGRLFRARGYADVRHFFHMAIELAEPPEGTGVPIESMREEDARAFHAALDESFRDHWEHSSTPFEEWWSRHEANPNRDLSLWFLVRDGGEIAAVARNEANRNGGGYVGALGVRRAWRGKGYAKALLLHTFREFYARGLPRVTLGVDAQSPTGATQLYRSVGMHVEQENVVYEKAIG
jgi:GNAT superfamily N-acetyltransferase